MSFAIKNLFQDQEFATGLNPPIGLARPRQDLILDQLANIKDPTQQAVAAKAALAGQDPEQPLAQAVNAVYQQALTKMPAEAKTRHASKL